MQVITMALGPVQANCFIYMDNGHALIVDPGDSFDAQKIMDEYNVQVDAILLTHAHFDHIGGVQSLVNQFQWPVYLNPLEFDFLLDSYKNASASFGMPLVCDIKPIALQEGLQRIGHFDVEAIFCPGHTIGSTVFKIGQCLLTGDVLFAGSIGRTDLYSGSFTQMSESLQKIKCLQGNYHILPGHGEFSTLDNEKAVNYYLK